MKQEFNVHIIDRSNPHESIMYVPENSLAHTRDGLRVGDYTRIESMRAQPNMLCRLDIALVNVDMPCACSCGHQHTKLQQYTVEPYEDGIPRGKGLKFLSPAQKRQVEKINKAIIDAAKEFPEMARLLCKVRG